MPYTGCFLFYILLSPAPASKSFPDTPVFDKQPFYQPNAIIDLFYTVAEKPLGSSNLKKG
jgi:hypothetical protein